MVAVSETVALPGSRTKRGRTSIVVGGAVLYAACAGWLLYGDGFGGLIALGVAGWAIAYADRRFGLLERSRLAARAFPGTAAAVALAAALLLPLPLAANSYAMHLVTMALIFAIMAIGLNVHLGGIGLVNIGYGGFFAIGAYAAALANHAGWSFPFAVAIAVFACVAAGAFLGLCATRTSGDYFALVTLGFGLIVHQLLLNLTWLTKGTDGIGNIRAPQILGHSLRAPIDLGAIVLVKEANFYYLSLALLAISVGILVVVARSWIGRTWSAMRADPISTGCFGVPIPAMKVKTVALGSAFGGIAGALYAHAIGFISPDDFTLSHSIELIAMVILGGIGNIWGVIVGAVLLFVIPEKLRILGDYRLLAFGALLVVLLVFKPRGIFPEGAPKVP